MATKFDGTEREERALNAQIALQRAADSVQKDCRTFRDAGLTTSQFGILDALYHLGPMHQKDLGEKLLKSDANTTTVVDNMEDQQLVRRERDPEDRRCYLIHLTEKGRDLFGSIFPDHVDRILEVFSVLSAEEQETLIRLCKKLGTHDPDLDVSDTEGGSDDVEKG